jgi:hypothetical protein
MQQIRQLFESAGIDTEKYQALALAPRPRPQPGRPSPDSRHESDFDMAARTREAEEARRRAEAAQAKRQAEAAALARLEEQIRAREQFRRDQRACELIEKTRDSARTIVKLRLLSSQAAELVEADLSELAEPHLRDVTHVVWFYLPGMDVSRRAWAVSTYKANQIDTRVFHDRKP